MASLQFAPLSIGTGTMVPVPMPPWLTSINSLERSPAEAAAGLSLALSDGQLMIAASAHAPIGTTVLSVNGVGCEYSICERRFSGELSVTVTPLTTPQGSLDGFSSPSPDRVQASVDHALQDELLFTVGTPQAPGTRAEAEAAAAGADGVLVGGMESAGIYQVRWATLGDLASAGKALEAQAGVASVFSSTVNSYGEDSAIPVSPAYAAPEWVWPFEQTHAPQAWELSTGSHTKVGIVDVGMVYDQHYDLNVVASQTTISGYASHATKVAGLACARAEYRGTVGFAWGCPLVSYPVGESGLNSRMLQAMVEMAETPGVEVVNASLGHNAPDKACVDLSEQTAIEAEVISEEPGFEWLFAGKGAHIVWTFSAGNNCAPGAASGFAALSPRFANVISVAATNSDSKLASFSNYGASISVAAPGGLDVDPLTNGVMSTDVASCGVGYCATYGSQAGTSEAAPEVAGVAALVREEDHTITAQQAGGCIKQTAGRDGIGATRGRSSEPTNYVPKLPYSGSIPILDAPAAVECAFALTLPPPPPLPASDGTIVGQGPTNGVIWRLASGVHGEERGQLELVVNGTAYSTLDPARAECVARHYVTRDFVKTSATDPLIWDLEAKIQAQCPSTAPKLALPGDATHWILRKANGEAWYLNGAGQTEPITSSGEYIECAQHYLVLDDVSQSQLDAFTNSGQTHAACVPLRLQKNQLPGVTSGRAYSQHVPVVGGRAPYSFTLVDGSLPLGLALGASGTISGMTEQEGVFHPQVRVRDSDGNEVSATLTLAVFAPSSAAPWETVLDYAPAVINTGAGRVSCPDQSHCWAVQHGQLVASEDGGQSWFTQQLKFPEGTVGNTAYVGGLSCGDDSRCMLVAGGTDTAEGRFVFATSDGGNSWSPVELPANAGIIAGQITCEAASRCRALGRLADGSEALLSTTDLGKSWAQAVFPEGLYTSNLSCAGKLCAVAGYGQSESVLAVSTDDGASWRLHGTGADKPYAVSCSTSRACVAAIELPEAGSSHLQVQYTEDGGSSWSSGAVPDGATYMSSISCPDESHCWGIGHGEEGAIFYSSDGGARWSESERVEHLGGTDISCPIAAECFVSGWVYGGGGTLDYSIVSTHDGGQEWGWQEVPLLGESRTLACAGEQMCLVGGNYANVDLQSEDGGETWTTTEQLDFPQFLALGSIGCFGCLGLHDLYAASCQQASNCRALVIFGFAFGIASSPGLFELRRGSWHELGLPAYVDPQALACVDAQTCFLSATGSGTAGVYVTHDDGASWTNTGVTAPEEDVGAISCGDERHCVVSVGHYDAGGLLMTNDGGTSWQQAVNGPSGATQLDCIESETCWASAKGAVWHSQDGGYSWEQDSVSGISAISCPDGEDCWAVGPSTGEEETYAIESTHDAGATWAQTGVAGEWIACPSITTCFSASRRQIYRMPQP